MIAGGVTLECRQYCELNARSEKVKQSSKRDLDEFGHSEVVHVEPATRVEGNSDARNAPLDPGGAWL